MLDIFLIKTTFVLLAKSLFVERDNSRGDEREREKRETCLSSVFYSYDNNLRIV